MRYSYLFLIFAGLLFSCKSENLVYLSSDEVHMSAPIIQSENLFFADSAVVTMRFSMPETIIKYTTNNSEVTHTSTDYNTPIILKKSTTIQAKNFHPDYISGETAILKLRKTNSKLAASVIAVQPAANQRYSGTGEATLTDLKKGSLSFSNNDKWLGFQEDSIRISIDFTAAKTVSKVVVSTMANHGAWIFLPHKIEVYAEQQMIGSTTIKTPQQEDITTLEFIEIPVSKNQYKELKIEIISLGEIPKWHQGSGTIPWFFTDEILVE